MSKRTFKDFLQADINNVFVKQDEFAETVMINGEPMEIVKDSDAINQFDVNKQVAAYDVLFHVAATYFDYIPQTGMFMEFEGEEYRIKRVDNNLGMLTIGLSRNDS